MSLTKKIGKIDIDEIMGTKKPKKTISNGSLIRRKEENDHYGVGIVVDSLSILTQHYYYIFWIKLNVVYEEPWFLIQEIRK
jgi:hypothetical protein